MESGKAKYQVFLETVDFSGPRFLKKEMTAEELKAWLALIHQDGSDRFLDEIASSSRHEIQFNVDMHPTVRIKTV